MNEDMILKLVGSQTVQIATLQILLAQTKAELAEARKAMVDKAVEQAESPVKAE
jgi:hypothetical protein